MKAVIVKEMGSEATVVDDFEIPVPGDDQILVQSIYTAINPVDSYMASSGILVLSWPLVLGCDASGVVVKAGQKAQGPTGPLKVGDAVLGCTRLGDKAYGTAQEYFLMDAALTTPKPDNISMAEAATVGVGFYTACLGVFDGLNIPIPRSLQELPHAGEEWALVLGGSSSVGKFALQLLKALGYKVVVTCSPKSSEMLRSLGASETLDYKKPETELLKLLYSTTGGKLIRIFDAVASNHDFVKAFYENVEGEKFFSTTNDWTPFEPSDFNGARISSVKLGSIGRPDAAELNNTITKLIPLMFHMLKTGMVQPAEYELIGNTGFTSVIEAWGYQQTGKAGSKKVLVKLQDF
ncbi:uncharacterized protein PV09_07746 [Verruconis gallopava]|uniref:Enoyl reductase (ER) domain-containing protein n=1 Tax=Verruconis gallopava TaxID=253628 RepID=A0A0D2A302_9PEZI|nr:uncharacterized protein PV09_07746 [Verruconis gallopava]KIW00765.1 hypothetical protein PV09_07746 [Verruconis gallopava]